LRANSVREVTCAISVFFYSKLVLLAGSSPVPPLALLNIALYILSAPIFSINPMSAS